MQSRDVSWRNRFDLAYQPRNRRPGVLHSSWRQLDDADFGVAFSAKPKPCRRGMPPPGFSASSQTALSRPMPQSCRRAPQSGHSFGVLSTLDQKVI